MTYVLDTNIFLRVLTKDDLKTFDDCVNLLEAVKSNKVEAVIPGIVISELVWTLSSFYELPKATVLKSVESILHLKGLRVVDDYDYHAALNLYQQHSAKYIDCLLATMNHVQSGEWQLVSFDRDFNKLGIQRVEPKNVRF